MLCVRTLGITEITFGDRRIGADGTSTLALLLLTALRAPRSIDRGELAALLWSDAEGTARNHRLRSLLHRTRQMGVPLEATTTAVRLAETPRIDFREFSTPPRTVEDIRHRTSDIGPVLPRLGVLPGTPLAARLDDERDVITATVIRWVGAALAIAKSAGEWRLVELLARAGRDVDSYNEEAWLSLAEAQCLTASKARALGTLDEYIASIGDREEAIALPAELLRRRVAEQAAPAHATNAVALPLSVDADVEDRVWSMIARAHRGSGGALLVWGAAGSGKTRLLREIERIRVRSATRVIAQSARLSPGAASLAFGLTARLLDQPGAAGCDPGCYRTLRRLTVAPNGLVAHDDSRVPMLDAFLELLAAVSDESTVVLLIDDAQSIPEADWAFWRIVVEWSRSHPVVWIFAYRAEHEDQLVDVPGSDVMPRVALSRIHEMSAVGAGDRA